MTVHSVHDRELLAHLLGRDPARYAYQLGDLDDFYWPYTTWYRHGETLALLYHGGTPPTLLAFADPGRDAELAELLTGLLPVLPRHFHAHLSPGAQEALVGPYRARPHGPHLKLALTDPDRLARSAAAGESLTEADLPELLDLYAVAYPGNWFDPRMLATGQYLGSRSDGRLVAVAGVHVWSPAHRICALGNVTTRPEVRGRGLATSLVAALCRRLLRTVDHITLNVHAHNAPALAVYARLGFTTVAEYVEYSFHS